MLRCEVNDSWSRRFSCQWFLTRTATGKAPFVYFRLLDSSGFISLDLQLIMGNSTEHIWFMTVLLFIAHTGHKAKIHEPHRQTHCGKIRVSGLSRMFYDSGKVPNKTSERTIKLHKHYVMVCLQKCWWYDLINPPPLTVCFPCISSIWTHNWSNVSLTQRRRSSLYVLLSADLIFIFSIMNNSQLTICYTITARHNTFWYNVF